MSRPLRIEYENAFYHVIARGERREAKGDGSCILVFDRLNCCHEIAKKNL